MKWSRFDWALATLAGGAACPASVPHGAHCGSTSQRGCNVLMITTEGLSQLFSISARSRHFLKSRGSPGAQHHKLLSHAPGASGIPVESGTFGNLATGTLGPATLSLDLFSYLQITCLVLFYFHNWSQQNQAWKSSQQRDKLSPHCSRYLAVTTPILLAWEQGCPVPAPGSTWPAVEDGPCQQGLPAHRGTPPRRRGRVGFSFMALRALWPKPNLVQQGQSQPLGTADPWAPQAEKELRSRARMCNGRWDFNNLSEILPTIQLVKNDQCADWNIPAPGIPFFSLKIEVFPSSVYASCL